MNTRWSLRPDFSGRRSFHSLHKELFHLCAERNTAQPTLTGTESALGSDGVAWVDPDRCDGA
jgi:hypothetical protein